MDKEKRKKTKISKYDIVKVTVHLDQHFFVFSRYILANVLRVIKVLSIIFNNFHLDLKQRLAENQFRLKKIPRRKQSSRGTTRRISEIRIRIFKALQLR